MLYKIVLLRHGESTWNKKNLFTGWTDVPLTKKGKREAKEGGKILKRKGYTFDIAFTSYLKKAIDTLEIVLKEMNLKIPVKKSWRLNERHYGALQGFNKKEMAKLCGEKQVFLWRRSYKTRPPLLDKEDPRWPGNDPLYRGINKKLLPQGESLKDTQKRVIWYWKKEIVPKIKSGKRILIVAHGNSLRALVKDLDNISDKEISRLNIPTGIPIVYELNEKMKGVNHFYLGNEKEIKKKIKGVIYQGKIEKYDK